MSKQPAPIANDNGDNKAGHFIGPRTYYNLIIVKNILREFETGRCHFPAAFVKRLKHDIELERKKDQEIGAVLSPDAS